jgi:hypothetical protein
MEGDKQFLIGIFFKTPTNNDGGENFIVFAKIMSDAVKKAKKHVRSKKDHKITGFDAFEVSPKIVDVHSFLKEKGFNNLTVLK